MQNLYTDNPGKRAAWDSASHIERPVKKKKPPTPQELMTSEDLEFLNNIVRPWESLNRDLSLAFSVDPELSDFATRANGLAVSIKHFPEVTREMKSKTLVPKSRSYEIISDLADSAKHRRLASSIRECQLRTGSMYERSEEGKFRFLRNVINISHKKYGKTDFVTCSMEAALFVAHEIGLNLDWDPTMLNNVGEFTHKMDLHISRTVQSAWRGLELHIVRTNENGDYEPVDMNSTVEFTLTSDLQ